jgi:hypothetical protein
MAKAKQVMLTGNVYCDWNAFTFVGPMPERLQPGDIVVWSWSGDKKKPSSKSHEGLLRASVYDGKQRRMLKMKNTRVRAALPFSSERDRESQLGVLVPELRSLKGRQAIKARRGFEVAPLQAAATDDLPSRTVRGRLKPGIRSEDSVTIACGRRPNGAPPMVAVVVAVSPVAKPADRSRRRHRRRKPHPGQYELF